MKSVFISYYQAFHDELVDALDKNEIRGYTFWQDVRGRGSIDGEPHYGTHAWPTINSAILTFVEDDKVDALLESLRELDASAPKQGLRAFVMPVDKTM